MLPTAVKAHRALGLTDEELERIINILGRPPSPTELAMFSVEWSEHCGYPRSRRFLKRLPRNGRYSPLVGTDAGGIVIDGHTVVFKTESHNHPSQVEPRAGAATGVGGIVRDILSMGARPVALLDSLRFGSLDDPMTVFYVRGVVSGIQQYGNCIGVPTVAGEVSFDPAYAGNTLVNVMCVGFIENGQRVMTSEAPPDSSIMYVGSRTGRDGIGGCSVLASRELQQNDQRPTVQIGDPFAGKCLIEATLEAIGTHAVLAVKDMGAAGLTCTTAEMAAAGRVAMEIDLDLVPLRETGMEPFEIMMSESQERMLMAVVKGHEENVRSIFHKWGLQAEIIGESHVGHTLTVRHHGEVVAELPVEPLTCRDSIELAQSPPDPKPPSPPHPPEGDRKTRLLSLLASPNICSRAWIFQQFDHTVQTNTIVPPGAADAAVIRLPVTTSDGATRGVALTFDCNPQYCRIDPFEGARRAVAEAALNVACVGGDPAGLTDCLNFGNPEKPDRFWQFTRAVDGIIDACTALDIPVVSGNVSFYNESSGGAVLPTPTIGLVGVVEDVRKVLTMAFRPECAIVLLGTPSGTVNGSECAPLAEGILFPLDLARHKALLELLLEAHRGRLLRSAHDLSEGGLLVAVAESCIAGATGATLDLTAINAEPDALFFGEGPSRVVITLAPSDITRLEALARRFKVPAQTIGITGGDSLVVQAEDAFTLGVDTLRKAHGDGLTRKLAFPRADQVP